MGQFHTHIKQLGMFAALTAVLLTGCGGEKTIDYTIEGMEQEEQPQSEGGNSDLERFAEEDVWEETWSEQISDKTFEVRMNAPVTVPKTAEMSVVRVEEPEFNAEYKENLAKRLFESEEIYYGDYGHLPKKDLEAMLAKFDQGFVLRSEENRTWEALDAESVALGEAFLNMENAGDSYVPVEDYTGDQYLGFYEGRLYSLEFRDTDVYANYSDMRKIFWTVRDVEEVCPEKAKELEMLSYYPWKRGNWVENQCRMSEEEAKKEAERFVDKLGLDYPVLSHTYPLGWGEEPDTSSFGVADSDDWYVDGYMFTFDLGIDDISFVDYGTEEDYWDFITGYKSTDEKRYSIGAQLRVYVTDQGIIRMEADNPVWITNVQGGVELLSLDIVKGIVRDRLKEHLEEYWDTFQHDAYTGEMRFDAMELIYFRVRDKENPGKYSYVPAWRLGRVTKEETVGMITIRNQVLVNAIDGTLIDFFDET